MKDIYAILKQMSLFDDIPQEGYKDIFDCLNCKAYEFKKGDLINVIKSGNETSGIILEGSVDLVIYSEAGTEHKVNKLNYGELFGYSFTDSFENERNVEIVADEKTRILFLSFEKFHSKKAMCCPYAIQFTLNLLKDTNKKNRFLTQKIEILSQRKLRDKINVYIKTLNVKGDIINIPFNRQELANYLSVDRSSLSRELCHMRDEGLLDFNKNKITLKNISIFN